MLTRGNLIKILFLTLLTAAAASCSFKESSTKPPENEIFIIRKYIGVYLDYRHTGMDSFSGRNLIWIKTTMDSTYGKISAYGKKCDFSPGDRLFLTRNYYSPGGITGYWIYMIENDSTLSYKVTDFQHDKKVMVNTFFN